MSVTIENLLLHERSGHLFSLTEQDFKGHVTMESRKKLLGYIYKITVELGSEDVVFFQAINMIDICLKYAEIKEEKELNLLGLACLFIASKKCDVSIAQAHELCYQCNGEFGTSDIIDTEIDIVKLMGFNVEFPNVAEYIRCISGTAVDNKATILARMLCIHYYYSNVDVLLPSVIATASYLIASSFFGDSLLKNPFKIPLSVVYGACESISKSFPARGGYEDGMDHITDKEEKCLGDFKSADFVLYVGKFKETCFVWNDSLDHSLDIEHKVSHYSKFEPKKVYPTRKDFRKIQRLGGGSYGDVHKVENKESGATYALKFNELEEDDSIRVSFLREVSILRNLQHKNIVKMIDVLENAKGFILELMDSDLKFFSQTKRFALKSFELQEKITHDLLCAVDYIHSQGVINRDIKPQNILVRGKWDHQNPEELEVKLCDFGISRGIGLLPTEKPYTTHVCTLWYRPPELLLGSKEYNCKIDSWSMACTLYEVFMNEVMFPGDYEIDQIRCIFLALGKPKNDTWSGVEQLPGYKDSWTDWVEKDTLFDIPLSKKVIEVIRKGLTLNPTKRPCVSELFKELIM